MERKSKKDLLEIIESQKEKLQRYESRISDVVRAYKGLLKEKEALELSLKALTLSKHSRRDANLYEESSIDVSSNNEAEKLASESCASDPHRCPSSYNEENTQELQNQIKTLSTAIATLTEEKSRMESAFQADKKRLLQEKEEVARDFQKEKDGWLKENKEKIKQTQELKIRLREQQQEREKEQQNHVLMLRELQSLLAEERSRKEKFERELEEVKEQVEKTKIPDKKSEEYEKCIQTLKIELKRVVERLKASEIKACQPSPLLLELQQEMTEMKVHHQVAVQQEQQRANEAEKKLKALAAVSEERVANLESRLSELSQMVGNYDRLRQQDQMSIHKLKERITQLDIENTTLAKSVGGGDREKNWEDNDISNADVQTLIERINKLKSFLKVANKRSERPINIEDFLRQEEKEEDCELHARCKEELQQLKEEFERYKLRAHSVLKSKNPLDSEVIMEEVQNMKSQNEDYKDKLQTAKHQLQTSEEYHKKVKEKLQAAIQEIKTKHKQEFLSLESEYKIKLLELEQQMQKQRERTLLLLEEKEKEIQILRASLKPSSLLIDTENISSNLASVPTDIGKHKSIAHQTSSALDMENLTDMLSHTLHTGKGEGQLLYYAQELARKDVEIANVGRARHQAESALRELQQVALTKEEKYTEEIDDLQARIRRLESSQSCEGINMEYLKNVVLRYIMCQDPNGRHHMLNAIATVLHFTPRELLQVRMFNQSWWWTANSSTQS